MTMCRRGNALILVAAVLVLLVIIATVFLSRTSALRQTGAAQRSNAFQDQRAEGVAEEVAQELALSLFVQPIEYTGEEYVRGLPVEEGRRNAPDPDSVRYDIDPLFAWNRAPYEVVPWTNPPDWLTWPIKPGPWHELASDQNITWDQRKWVWDEVRPSSGCLLYTSPSPRD